MPVKLSFTVAGCSGEDPDFPVAELLYHSQDSKGWCTPRYCTYPQDLTLRLEQPARLAQIQLLSHEFKIASKVELLVGTFDAPGGAAAVVGAAPPPPANDPSKATWRRLGFLSFDANERSSFTARELKSVALNGTPAHLLRLVFHRCHSNAANMYGQVSLVAISLMGDPLAPVPLAPITNTGPYGMAPLAAALPGGLPTGMVPQQQPAMHPSQQYQQQYVQPPAAAHQQQQQQQSQTSGPAEAAAAIAADLGVDIVTAQRIYDLQQQKQQAVEREDYDEAKRLKVAVDRLRAAGGAIAQLEARKRAAVEEEDYDLAKQLKQEVDRLRNSAYAAALPGHSSSGVEAAFSPPRSRRASTLGPNPHLAAAVPRPSADGSSMQSDGGTLQHGAASEDSGQALQANPAAPARRQQQASASPLSDWNSYDDRPAQAGGTYSFQHADETSLPTSMRRSSTVGGGSAASGAGRAGKARESDAGPPPPGFPADLPPPEALSAADAKDAGPLMDLAGEYLVRCMFSRTWQLREAALARLAKDMEAGKLERLEGSSEAFKTVTRALLRTLKDKVAAVFSASLATLRALVAAQASKCPAREMQAALGELLPVLVEKAADLNQRTREQATEALVALAGVPEAGLRAATGPFLRAPKTNAAWKVVLGRLQLVSALLPVIGMAGRSSEGFALEALMDFVNPAFGNSSAEVRGAAVALTVQIAQLAGPSVQRMLPSDLNAKVREQIEQGLLNPSPAAAAGLGARVSPRTAAARGAAAGPAPRQQPATAAAAAAAPGRGQPPAAAPPQQPAPAAAPAAGAMLLPPQMVEQPAPYAAAAAAGSSSSGGAPVDVDDPAAFEAEVRAREARLGPSHPEVAEAICNLAIIHNQHGNMATALPLYERALAIWEAACGPDSPDVAHTLTDIAVIHLEQGRDDIGRPLLQRALRIQEAHLGPEHPDVIAIRDVLEEDEDA